MHLAEKTKHTISELINLCVADHFNTNIDFIKSKSHTLGIIIPRQIAIYLHRKFTDLTLAEIGSIFGSKDHTTVMNSLKRVENRCDTEKYFKSKVKQIELHIKKCISMHEDPTAFDFYYTLDLDNFDSVRFKDEKFIVMKGFTDEEIEAIQSHITNHLSLTKKDTKKHENTGVFIFDKI